jgi:glycogen debranching enzyme
VRDVLLLADHSDGAAIWEWLDSLPDVRVSHLASSQELFESSAEVLWMHGSVAPPAGLLAWIERGGRLLATLGAARVPHLLRVEPVAPDDERQTTWHHADDEFWLEEYRSFQAFPHIRGLAGFGPHPLFAGLHQGTFTWAPSEGEPYAWTAYQSRRPAQGRVVAVERSFIHVNPERAVAWEHAVGEGGILSIGAFIHPAAPDQLLQRQLRALLGNALLGDGIPHRDRAVPVSAWPPAAHRCVRDESIPVPSIHGVDDGWGESTSNIELTGAVRDAAPWTLAGRRILLVGSERDGLREVWSHPFRLMRDIDVQADGLPVASVSIRVLPDQVSLAQEHRDTPLTQRWTTALERPAMVWDIATEGDHEITIGWNVDLRRMWPYPAGNFGDLRWNVNDTQDHLWIGAAGASVQVLFRIVGGRFHPPVANLDPVPHLRLRATGQGTLRLVAAAAVDSSDLAATLRALDRKKLDGVQRQRRQHAEQLIAYGASVESPDPDLSTAFEWAKVRVDSCLVETPGIGRSLVAGYGSSRSGWADGRPGYAWYFGRDACWTAFGDLAAGHRESTRDVLHFLAATQDVSGKILHEYTTSGLVHYDAADSTPLFLLLAGRYASWTGDLEFLGKHWAAIERAYRFCLETDSDGDGIIENARVGHGWIEHGPLGGAAVTLYLASCWLAALEELEPLADALGKMDLADDLRERIVRVRSSIRSRFYHDEDFALGLREDGSAIMHRTAMLAVPILLGAVLPAEAARWLDAAGGDSFTAPWGVRMIATSDPLYDPTGYHLGAVWPLYTGWVSLAEFRAGRPEAGLSHLLANAGLVNQRERGAFDEVLHGDNGADAGICPDQAWSASMVLLPAVQGLWGIVPDAINSSLSLTPYLPPHWNRMSLRRLRVGKTVLDIDMRKISGRLVVRLHRRFGPGLHVRLAPQGLVGGQDVRVDEVALRGPRVQFEVRDHHEVIYTIPPL